MVCEIQLSSVSKYCSIPSRWRMELYSLSVHVFGVGVAAEDRADLAQGLVSAVGLLVHGQGARDIRDEVGEALGLYSRRSLAPSRNHWQPPTSPIRPLKQPSEPVFFGTAARSSDLPACSCSLHVEQRRARWGSVSRQRAARQAGAVDGLMPDMSPRKNCPTSQPVFGISLHSSGRYSYASLRSRPSRMSCCARCRVSGI